MERAREKEKVVVDRYGLCSCGSIWVRGKKYGDTPMCVQETCILSDASFVKINGFVGVHDSCNFVSAHRGMPGPQAACMKMGPRMVSGAAMIRPIANDLFILLLIYVNTMSRFVRQGSILHSAGRDEIGCCCT